jgi:hypothetical protein
LSRMAEIQVRSDTYAFSTLLSHVRTQQRLKQGKMKEKRKKVKMKKAVGIANAKAKKAAKVTKMEPISGPTFDVDEVAPPLKRVKTASSSARETMKSHIPGKSKRKPRTDDGARLA